MIRSLLQASDRTASSSIAETTRAEALSDGVFAIAMTVLVLDLRAPVHADGRLLHAVLEQWPAYVGFVASFLFIGVIWTNHHATFRQIAAADRAVVWANLGILGGTVLLPFPTAVLADAFRRGNVADEQTAAMLYAGLAIGMSMAWLALFGLARVVRPAPSALVRGPRRAAPRAVAGAGAPADPGVAGVRVRRPARRAGASRDQPDGLCADPAVLRAHERRPHARSGTGVTRPRQTIVKSSCTPTFESSTRPSRSCQ